MILPDYRVGLPTRDKNYFEWGNALPLTPILSPEYGEREFRRAI
jgi:hypothetical protein